MASFTKSKKHLVLLSALILLCCTLSVTGTIAWFTDETTSAGNVINAGDLDVELLHTNSVDTDEQVTPDVQLFDGVSNGLWEPGALAYEKLSVQNVGSVTMKYIMNLKVDQEAVVNGRRLSEAIKYAFVSGDVDTSSRSALISAGKNSTGGWHTLAESPTVQGTGTVTPSNGEDWFVILYWEPAITDNLYNMNNDNQGVQLDMEVSVVLTAAQWTDETDSFGSNYDEDATFAHALVAVADENGDFLIRNATNSLEVAGEAAADAPVAAEVTDATPSEAVLNVVTDGQSVTSYDINVVGQKEGSLVTVRLQMEPGMTELKVFHRDTLMSEAGSTPAANTYEYDAVTGVLTMYADDFCPFHFVYRRPGRHPGHKPSDSTPTPQVTSAPTVDPGEEPEEPTAEPTTAPTASPTTCPFEYINNGTHITIIEYTGSDTEVTVPDTLEGLPVTVIAGLSHNVTHVTLPDSVTEISDYAFQYCRSLKTIDMPATLTTLGESAFAGCTALEEITLPAGLKSIQFYVFSDCDSLKKVVIPEGVTYIGESSFQTCDLLSDITLPSTIEHIGEGAFINCPSLTEINLPEGLLTVGDTAFADTGLTSVRIPSTVTTLSSYGTSPFSGCANLTYLELAEGITDIGECWFMDMPALKTVKLPSTLESIGNDAFHNCPSLDTINFPEVLRSIGDAAFSGCGFKTIVLPSGVRYLGSAVFSYCRNLTDAELPIELTEDGGGMFTGCTSLTKLASWSNGTSYISEGAYKYCTGLTSLDLSSLANVPSYAFIGCTGLTSITLPDTQTIGMKAFSDCTNLSSVTLSANLDSVDSYAFQNCTSLTSISLPNVRTINMHTFSGCTNLSSVTLSANLDSVGSYAFQNCTGLTSIVLPENVTNIYERAFKGCTGLTSVTLPTGEVTIDSTAFEGCSATLEYIVVDGSAAHNWCVNNKKTNITVIPAE